MDNTEELTHVSLCAGYGGIDLGLKRAIGNVRTVAYSEIEAFPVANMVAKMEKGLMDVAPIWSNLKTFPWSEFRGKMDILSGGFPCQPFSAAGKGDGDEDPRHLFPYILDGIRIARPAIVFLENVEGIVSAKLKNDNWNDPAGTPVLLHVIRELERVGYTATAIPTSASEVGAPHQRNRWFIIGVADGMCERLEGLRERCNKEGREEQIGQPRSSGNIWPSRPGEDQYGWEPPRTLGAVANTSNTGTGQNDRGVRERSCGTGGGEETNPQERQGNVANSADLGCGGRTDQDGGDIGRVQELPSEERPMVRSEVEGRSGDGQTENSETQPAMGGNANGTTDRMGPTELYDSCGGSELANTEREGLEGQRNDSAGLDRENARLQSGAEDGGDTNARETQPAMGGNANGTTDRMGPTELYDGYEGYNSCDNRTDELRMLGNGVVPASAELAFKLGIEELVNRTATTPTDETRRLLG